jgi:uncharacterized cupredoxin-like copper-binding protein
VGFRASKNRQLLVRCPIPGHTEAGMTGEIAIAP